MEELTDVEVSTVSGAPEDVTKSLDSDQTWLKASCSSCGNEALLSRPDPGTNTVAQDQVVEVTLPDGSTTEIELPVEVDKTTLLWACNKCGTKQETEL